MKHYLLIDLGTGNSRVALVNSQGDILGLRTYTNAYYRDEHYEDGQYFLPEEWERNLMQGCRELCAEFPDIQIDAVSSAGARQSFVLIDREDRAFYGLPNIDNRGRSYMSQVEQHEEIYRLSGKWATEDFGAAKFMGFQKVYPELYASVKTITSLSEWVAWFFTGKAVMEHSQACESQLYDIREKQWSETLCKLYGLDMDLLPRLQSAGEVVGSILPAYREGLNFSSDAVFILGGADTQIALLQTGIQPGDLAIVSGTTSPVTAQLDDCFYDPEQRVWTDMGLGGESYHVEMNPGVTGLNYQRMVSGMCSDLTYQELEKAYREKTSFSCTASFASLLFYQRRSLRNGGFFMRSPMAAPPDRVDLAWAVLADIACSTNEQLRYLTQLTDNRSPYVLGCGGGFQSAALCQMIADLSGREVRLRGGFSQATVQGLITLCCRRLGEREPALSEEIQCYSPREKQLIHEYEPLWRKNRDRANP